MRASGRTLRTIALLLTGLLVVAATPGTAIDASTADFPKPLSPVALHAQKVIDSFGNLPLHFEPNLGQFDSQVRFVARAAGYTLFLTDTESVIVLSRMERGGPEALPHQRREPRKVERAVARMKLVGSRMSAEWTALERLPGITNYFIGNHPEKWRTHIPQYAKVQVRDIYKGVDLVYHGDQGSLEYDFVVHPGADPGQIQLAWENLESMELNAAGDLVLVTRLGEVLQKRPSVYQQIGDEKVEVASAYLIDSDHRLSFEIASYDRSQPLLIDPLVLVYSTYLGFDRGYNIAVDAAGWMYVAGTAPQSRGFLLYVDAFIARIAPTGDEVYVTYLGSINGDDVAFGIAVDRTGSLYVTGITETTDFPTRSAYQSSYQGGETDCFVAKLTAAGDALVYSTYLGGSGKDWSNSIALGDEGSAYITGYTDSSDYPTQLPYQSGQGNEDIVVTKLTPAGNALAYSTYLGGSGSERGTGIALDGEGSAYITGYTNSSDYPTQSFYQSYKGNEDIVVTKLTPPGNALAYSTYLGGSGNERGTGIALDGEGSVYITGYTDSSDYPTQLPYQSGQGNVLTPWPRKTPRGTLLHFPLLLLRPRNLCRTLPPLLSRLPRLRMQAPSTGPQLRFRPVQRIRPSVVRSYPASRAFSSCWTAPISGRKSVRRRMP